MSKRLSNSKRLQLINKWLRGIDDDEYEVFPCKTEGKYFVRPRKTKLKQTTKNVEEKTIPKEQKELESEQNESEQESIEEPTVKPKTTNEIKSIPKSKIKQTNLTTSNQFYDPTINIEILNQLKLLGEEFKMEREKKEQKRMIKEVVHKQITKPKMQYNYTDPDYTQQPNQDVEIIEQPITCTTLTRRRKNIFADVF